MKIHSQVYDEIMTVLREEPPEMGGILGKKDELICSYEIDYGKTGNHKCNYYPMVHKLNSIIARWEREGIEFAGMFHTHFYGVETLSPGDEDYIIKIMRSMPSHIKELSFPIIVLPEKRMVSYKAIFVESHLEIAEEDVKIEGGTDQNE